MSYECISRIPVAISKAILNDWLEIHSNFEHAARACPAFEKVKSETYNL